MKRILCAALLLVVSGHRPASAEFIDQMGGGATSPNSSVNLFEGAGAEKPIEIDLKQKQDALFEDDGSTTLEPLVVQYEKYNVVPVRVRNLAETHIFFPEDEVIEDVLTGDPAVFDVDFPRVSPSSAPTRKNMLVVRLVDGVVGADSSMTAVGRLRANGERRKYLFLLSGWSYRAETLSNFFVFIEDDEESRETPARLRTTAARTNGGQIERTPEYLREIPFDPTDISFNDYEPMRPSNVTDEELQKIMPEQIWTDGYWTYLQYGERQADIMPWVTVRRVVDGISSPVDYLRHPKKHNVLVVQTVGENLFLRNGEKRVLCLIWVAGQGYVADQRQAAMMQAAPGEQEAAHVEAAPLGAVEETTLPASDPQVSSESEGL